MENMSAKWKEALGIKENKGRVCFQHFAEKDILQNSRNDLRNGAVPSLRLGTNTTAAPTGPTTIALSSVISNFSAEEEIQEIKRLKMAYAALKQKYLTEKRKMEKKIGNLKKKVKRLQNQALYL